MTVLPINKLPLAYYENQKPILGIKMDAIKPTWMICQWCPIQGEFVVDEVDKSWFNPTHFCELPEVPK